jgi:hypothetical protein
MNVGVVGDQQLSFPSEFAGSDRRPRHQADVMAVSRSHHQVLIGEAKWEDDVFDY